MCRSKKAPRPYWIAEYLVLAVSVVYADAEHAGTPWGTGYQAGNDNFSGNADNGYYK